MSFDAWGRRRDPESWVPYQGVTVKMPLGLTRGYTMHEHLQEFGLINMNGRMYDPILGLMLSPDNFVSDATSTIAYNRYLYANGNPLKYTDPSGEIALWDDLIVAGVGFAVGYLSYGLQHGDWGKRALASGAIGAGTALLSYYTAGGFSLAAGGSVSGGASFAGSYSLSSAVNTLTSAMFPGVNIPVSKQYFSISVYGFRIN